MPQISLITKDTHLAQLLIPELQKKCDCKLLGISESDLHSEELVDQPEIVIVDLPSIDQPKREFFDRLKHTHPEVSIIVMVKNEQGLSAENLNLYSVDEVFPRPQDKRQLYRIKEKLLNRIAVLARLKEVQERLRIAMRESQIVAKSRHMRQIVHQLPQLAKSYSTILITGETGTGKELIARALHYLGPRSGRPFVTVDCGSIPENLVENELFGHVRGAYTDAGSPTRGLIQEADGGTLFLDEIESLPLPIQSRFLRFLQERQLKPLGKSQYVSMDIRVVAATNKNLDRAVREHTFRKDLFYRLNVLPVFLHPLRDRRSDIPALVHHFFQKYNQDQQNTIGIPAQVVRAWLDHPWPGNVRQLENKVQEWLILQKTESWTSQSITATPDPIPIRKLSEVRKEALARCEYQYLELLLAHTRGNISAAARLSGMNRKSLGILLKRHGIDVNRFRSQ